MGTKLSLKCDGCSAVAEGMRDLIRVADITECVPDGWVWRDPYTHATYCPDCWASILRCGDAD